MIHKINIEITMTFYYYKEKDCTWLTSEVSMCLLCILIMHTKTQNRQGLQEKICKAEQDCFGAPWTGLFFLNKLKIVENTQNKSK
jgi:hypothetical protein